MVKRLSLIVIFLAVTPLEIKANWQFLDLPTDRGYTTIFAPNEASIFVDGHYGLWKTYDSGSTWAIDSHSVLGYNWITDICFTDSLRGFIAGADTTAKGGGIRRTLDGGKTWGKVSFDTVGENLAAKFSFPHSQKLTGYAMGGTCVFKTTDGGGTWKWISTIPLVYPGYEEYDVYRDICFPKVDTGYLTGEFRYKVDSNYYPAHYGFFKTTDGGQTWKMDSVPLYNDDFNPNLVVFPENPSVGYMTGGYIKDTTWTGCVFKTIDGGATWDTVLKTPVGHPDIYDICFPETDQVGYVLNDTMIHKTMDGGKTWRTFGLGKDTVFLRCHFLNNQIGFISGTGTNAAGFLYTPGFVMKTTDGLLSVAEEDWVDVKPQIIELSALAFFSDVLKVTYNSRSPGCLKACVFDAVGRQVRSLDPQTVSGQGILSLPCLNLASGVYFVSVEFHSTEGSETKTLRTVKIR